MTLWETPQFAAVQRLLAGREVWLVGGGVRDWLLGRPVADADLALAGAKEVARQVARALKGALVALDEEMGSYRVVVSHPLWPKGLIFDFNELQGGSLEEDLARRDFTINAIAHPLADFPPSAQGRWVDPFDGRGDLRRRWLRGIAAANFHHDPVRCLRAFRFAAQLGFVVEPRTLEWVAEAAPGLVRMPGERLWQELQPLLEVAQTGSLWRLMAQRRVAQHLLPDLDWEGEPFRGQILDALDHQLKAWGCSPSISLASLRLAALAWDAEKAALKRLARRLRLSRREEEALLHLPPLARALEGWMQEPSGWGSLWAIYRQAPTLAEEGLLLAKALWAVRFGGREERAWGEVERYFRGPFREAWKRPLLRGGEVVALAGREGGPWVGRLLEEAMRAQALGEIRTPAEALEWARRRLEEGEA